jgi:asparagine synthase (glutamine-hydrolysing)
MADAIRHRGPDDEGVWVDESVGLVLGHRRLSILDLSREGHQPMVSSDDRWVIVYNGEIYNFHELRHELETEDARFRGTSDTEVALEAVAHWGVERAVRRFVGMFAFGAWDRRERELWLVRDRLGIKPLYYGRAGQAFVFASELKAICALDEFERVLDPDVLPQYLRYGYVPSPHCVFRGLRCLAPGTMLRVAARAAAQDVEPIRYWSLVDVAESDGDRSSATSEEVDDRVETVLREAVRLRMVADVPLGAFLSGGIDSSLVVALMQQESGRPVRTFTIGFHERGYDEAPHAARIAAHLGTDHTEVYLDDHEAMAIVPDLPEIWDEPFADSSQIPTWLVSRVARQGVTVALSGDGGDELFGGYTRYFVVDRDWRWASRFGGLRRPLASVLRGVAAPAAHPLRAAMRPLLRVMGKPTTAIASRLEWRAGLLDELDFARFYHRHAACVLNPGPADILADGMVGDGLAIPLRPPGDRTPIERMMLMDTCRYLPDDILTKVDRASMAVSLEARVPVLDHRVVEAAWQLPYDRRVGPDPGKALLRRLLARHVPPQLFDRPKMGFGIPFGEWLRDGLRDWAEALLAPAELTASGWFDVGFVTARWREHLAGAADHRNLLWAVLMLQAWRLRWRVS